MYYPDMSEVEWSDWYCTIYAVKWRGIWAPLGLVMPLRLVAVFYKIVQKIWVLNKAVFFSFFFEFSRMRLNLPEYWVMFSYLVYVVRSGSKVS